MKNYLWIEFLSSCFVTGVPIFNFASNIALNYQDAVFSASFLKKSKDNGLIALDDETKSLIKRCHDNYFLFKNLDNSSTSILCKDSKTFKNVEGILRDIVFSFEFNEWDWFGVGPRLPEGVFKINNLESEDLLICSKFALGKMKFGAKDFIKFTRISESSKSNSGKVIDDQKPTFRDWTEFSWLCIDKYTDNV